MVKPEGLHSKDTLLAMLMFNELIKDAHEFVLERKIEFDPRYTNLSLKEISTHLKTFHKCFKPNVELWRSSWWYRNVLGTTYTGDFDLIRLNSRNINRSIESLVGSIAHEWGHCFEYYLKDNVNKNIVLNHGNNNKKGKENTFQYWFGDMMKEKTKVLLVGAYLDLNLEDTAYGQQKRLQSGRKESLQGFRSW